MSAADWVVVAGFVLAALGLWLNCHYGRHNAALLEIICRRLGVEGHEESDNRPTDTRL